MNNFKTFFLLIVLFSFTKNTIAQNIIVSQAENSTYKTIQAAIDAAPINNISTFQYL